MPSIEIYGQAGCTWCVAAKQLCERLALPYVYRDIADLDVRAEMFRRNKAAATVPQIFIGERRIGGYDDLAGIPVSTLQQMIGG